MLFQLKMLLYVYGATVAAKQQMVKLLIPFYCWPFSMFVLSTVYTPCSSKHACAAQSSALSRHTMPKPSLTAVLSITHRGNTLNNYTNDAMLNSKRGILAWLTCNPCSVRLYFAAGTLLLLSPRIFFEQAPSSCTEAALEAAQVRLNDLGSCISSCCLI